MADFKNKYKTYNTSEFNFGNEEEWKKVFESIFSGFSGKTETFNFKRDEKEEKSSLKTCKTKLELKTMFRKLMQENHPDIVGDTKQANERTAKIIEEYNLLSKKLK